MVPSLLHAPPRPFGAAAGRVACRGGEGGQVVVAMGDDTASLVTAVPNRGYETQTWKTDFWFRVDFAGDERRSSIIVTWHDGPPRATVTEF